MGRAKKNILFIMCDQLRWDYLSCYGHPHLATPNIDRLAQHGVRFDSAYCQAPLCGPSRASMYTGRYPSSIGTFWNFERLGIMYWTIGDYLRQQGYRSAVVGKTHSFADIDNMERLGIKPDSEIGQRLIHGGFEPFERDDGLHPDGLIKIRGREPRYNEYLRAQGYKTENPWDRNANGTRDENDEFGSGWYMQHNNKPADIDEPHSETPYMTSRAIDCIEAMGDTPWCIHLSYIKPHWPYQAPAPYHNMYSAEQILPQNASQAELEDPHPVYEAFTNIRGSKNFSRQEVRERVIPAYMGLIKQIDDQIGRLQSWLVENGHAENTVIVFTSDHGDFLGDHWLGEKDCFFEEAARIPLIIYDPSPEADNTRGTVETRFVEGIDFAATFLDIAGGEPQPHRLEGRSLLPLIHNKPVATWREYAISEMSYHGRAARQELGVEHEEARGYMIRDKRWKYILWEGFSPQLFDLANDPHELNDLGRQATYESICREWHDELFSWLRHRASGFPNSPAYLRKWGPEEEDRDGVLIGYWNEEEGP